ncbi:MAG TPA: molybdopterin-binding protein [Anaerolineaceae bacterium]|nr:molybdopterin-binding protein [Anaerolineaceae bacterium]
MPAAEIITIGTELLLGEIQDTNTRYLARLLRDHGVDLYRTSIVGDNVERIAQAIQESLARCQIIITTGGLGPTVDDPTRQAAALAAGVELEFRPDLWTQIQERFKRYNRPPTENNRRQAFIPKGAIAIENPVGTAPAFIIETDTQAIISLPGVPPEMEYLAKNTILPYLTLRYHLHGIIKACVLHTSGVGESQVDEWVGDLETLANPTVGLLARPGQVDIRVTVKADSEEVADQKISEMVAEIEKRLGDNLFGKDEETLEQVIASKFEKKAWKLNMIEHGVQGRVAARLGAAGLFFIENKSASDSPDLLALQNQLENEENGPDEINYAVSFQAGTAKQTLHLAIKTPDKRLGETRTYGGAPGNGLSWAVNSSLDFLRRNI